jgi:alpha-aminoadipic semialdehyde synthase
MATIIGVRREDKSRWERRVPIVPADVASLAHEHGARFMVQPSPIRVFGDEEYAAAGAELAEDLAPADIVLAVKEVPIPLLTRGRIYVYFAHVIKGQRHNMPMLKRLLELGATLIDYEKIVDERGARLIFFGRHAGYAGMIETLRALGQRLASDGKLTPLVEVKSAYEYRDLSEAQAHIRALGAKLAADDDPDLRPLVFGVAGYGNVAKGARAILDCLPVERVSVGDLPRAAARGRSAPALVEVVFKEEDMVLPRGGWAFDLQDYYRSPERYQGRFETYLPYLDVLVNTIYWEPRYPRLVTKEWAQYAWGGGASARLRVIGDISCDIDGSVELTVQATQPDAPCFVWDPGDGRAHLGVLGHGPVIMAVDNLPCELPRDASKDFSAALRPMIPGLIGANWGASFADLSLPPSLKNAIIVYRGELTPAFRYLEQHLAAASA